MCLTVLQLNQSLIPRRTARNVWSGTLHKRRAGEILSNRSTVQFGKRERHDVVSVQSRVLLQIVCQRIVKVEYSAASLIFG